MKAWSIELYKRDAANFVYEILRCMMVWFWVEKISNTFWLKKRKNMSYSKTVLVNFGLNGRMMTAIIIAITFFSSIKRFFKSKDWFLQSKFLISSFSDITILLEIFLCILQYINYLYWYPGFFNSLFLISVNRKSKKREYENWDMCNIFKSYLSR